MARVVKINPIDEVIIVRGEHAGIASAKVHRHLLLDRSYETTWCTRDTSVRRELRKMVKQTDTAPEPNHLSITLPKLDARALEIYAASLYGQSMIWDDFDERKIEDEFCSLIKVHRCCDEICDIHGADESIDAIRCLIKEKGDKFRSPPLLALEEACGNDTQILEMIIDFIVYGESCKIFRWLYPVAPWKPLEREYPDFVALLCREFARRAAAERSGNVDEITTADDLDDYCRYHSHVDLGLPCYKENLAD